MGVEGLPIHERLFLPGGDGGATLIFQYIYVGLAHFWVFKILNTNIFGVFRKKEYFLGMKILWIFLWGHCKLDYVFYFIFIYLFIYFFFFGGGGGSFYTCILGSFLKVNV